MATKVLSATIDEELARKLDELASETHRKKSYFVNHVAHVFLVEGCIATLSD